MRTRFFLTVLAISFALSVAVGVPAVQAVTCQLNLIGLEVASVEVQGGQCKIIGTIVKGDIINRNGVVLIEDSRIEGNIRSNGGAMRLRGGVRVKGYVRIDNATAVGGIVGDNNVIEGSLVYSNSSDFAVVHYGAIGGTLALNNNSGGVSLIGNSVGQDLVCTDNRPRPSGHGNNSGNRKGQCARFEKVRYGASVEVYNDGTPRQEAP